MRATLEQKGSDALLAALMKLKPRAGYIRNPSSGNVAWSIRFARVQALPDGGRQITLATDRPMSFWEVMNRPRSVDYGFTLAEIRLDKNGKGEGKLVPAAKVAWNKEKQTLEIENHGMEPVRLTEVTVDDRR